MRFHHVPLVAVVAATALSAQTWTRQSPTIAPSLRRAGAMAFDASANRLLLYGGTAPGPGQILAETWAYNGSWQQLTSAGGVGRWGHQIVRDTANNRLVTFGGRSPSVAGFANDTVVWNGTTWTNLPTPTAPPVRFAYGMCFDTFRNRVVLFGGRGTSATFADTWEFDGIAWSQVPTALAPSPRAELAMVFDDARRRAVVFGGIEPQSGAIRGDTWEYANGEWTLVNTVNSPSPRYRAACAYDSARLRTVLYGGYDGTAISTATFEFTGDDWRTVSVGPGSVNATEMYVGYDPVRRRFVTFGGVGAAFSNDTWEFTGVTSALFNGFGNGCPTTAGIAGLQAVTPPVLGTTFSTRVANAPAGTPFAFFGLGLSDLTWSGQPLPFDLSPLGLAGCSLEVAADALQIVFDNQGELALPFPLPNTPSLAGVSLFLQAFVPDSGVANRIGGMSRPARAVFGTVP